MKALNNMKFITEATTTFNGWLANISSAENYDHAKRNAATAVGFVDCMIVYLNTMIDRENNDFTADLGDVLDEWMAKIYQKVADKAIETNQPNEVILSLLKRRDEYLNW